MKGPHRILCGDCRKQEDVKRLFAGAKANVVITSPPYASQRKYDESSGFKPIAPDKYVDWFRAVATGIESVLAPDGSYFLNIKEHAEDGERHLYVKDLTIAHRRQWGWRFVDEFCWRNTANGVPGFWKDRLKNAWEPVFHFSRGPVKFRPLAAGHQSRGVFEGDAEVRRSRTGSGFMGGEGKEVHDGIAWPSNVIEVKAESAQGEHTAPFPVALVEFFIKAFSDPGDIIFDPFMGSGSTLIAAAKLGRIGYGMELSPAYCDVIVRRLMNFDKSEARLEGDGRTFDELKSARLAAGAAA